MLARTPAEETPTSAALVARTARGEEAAFTALVARLRTPALRLAARVLHEPAEAEDAVQAALVKLWQKADSYRPELGSVEGWFARIVVNSCLDRRRMIRPAAPLEAAGDLADEHPGPDEVADTADRARRTRNAIARLSPRQRAAILLFYGEEQSTAEVAQALETSPKAVEGLLARARADLARMLGELRSE